MPAQALAIAGAYLWRPQIHSDNRGTFHRVVDAEEMRVLHLDPTVAQVSMATNRRAGTVRGLHYQAAPNTEAKTLWCTRGSVFDVLVDLRPGETTYGTWISVELSAAEPHALHIPRGVAHGYQTLADDSELTYLISTPYHPESARVLHWKDPTVGIRWPMPATSISDRDREAPPWPPSP